RAVVVVIAVAVGIVIAVAVVPAVWRCRLGRRRRLGCELLADRDLDLLTRDRRVHEERVLVLAWPGQRDRPLPDVAGLSGPLAHERRLFGTGQTSVRMRAGRGYGDQQLIVHARV